MSAVHPIKTLTPRSVSVRVRGRILKLWDARKRGQIPFGKNFVIADGEAKGGAIQGLILSAKYVKVADFFVEGRVCELGKFTVRPLSFGCKTVSHGFSLLLSKDCIVMDLGCDNPSIPRCYLEVCELEEVSAGKYPEESLIDVIGRISGFGSVEHVTANGADLRIRNMYIMNNRGCSLDITLWEDQVDRFDAVALATKSSTGPVIVGCSTVQVRKFRDVFGLKTIAVSRFFVDVESLIFSDFRSGLPSDLPTMFVDGADDFPRPTGPMALPVARAASTKVSLGDLRPLEKLSESMQFECAVEIVSLNDRFGWYYPACPSCYRRVSEDGDLVKCVNDTCKMFQKRVIDIPWYRLPLEVSDGTDSVEFVLLGKHGDQVVGLSAAKVLADHDQASEDAPLPLLNLIGKRFLFVFGLSKLSGQTSYRNFTVSRVLPVPGDVALLMTSGVTSSSSFASSSVSEGPTIQGVVPPDSVDDSANAKLKGPDLKLANVVATSQTEGAALCSHDSSTSVVGEKTATDRGKGIALELPDVVSMPQIEGSPQCSHDSPICGAEKNTATVGGESGNLGLLDVVVTPQNEEALAPSHDSSPLTDEKSAASGDIKGDSSLKMKSFYISTSRAKRKLDFESEQPANRNK